MTAELTEKNPTSLFYHDTQGKDTEHIMLDTNWLHR